MKAVEIFLRIPLAIAAMLFTSVVASFSAPGDENWDAAFGVPGVEGGISAMAVSGNDLYVGGEFSRIGGVEAINVARWDGTNWHSLGPGLGGTRDFGGGGVAALAVARGELYAGGYFTSSGTNYLIGVVKWDGNSWRQVDSNLLASSIRALAWDGRHLYAGGTDLYSYGVNLSNIAKWDGTYWSALGSGLQYWQTGVFGGPRDFGTVQALVANYGVVYAGGTFENAGALRVTNVARWDGTSWTSMASRLGTVSALAVNAQGVFAGGSSGVQLWDGVRWTEVGGQCHGILSATRQCRRPGNQRSESVYRRLVSRGRKRAGGQPRPVE